MSSVGLCQNDWWKVALNTSVCVTSGGLWAGMRRLGKPYGLTFTLYQARCFWSFLIISLDTVKFFSLQKIWDVHHSYTIALKRMLPIIPCATHPENFQDLIKTHGKRDGLHVVGLVWLLNQLAEYSWDEKFNILNFFLPHLNIIWTRFNDAA